MQRVYAIVPNEWHTILMSCVVIPVTRKSTCCSWLSIADRKDVSGRWKAVTNRVAHNNVRRLPQAVTCRTGSRVVYMYFFLPYLPYIYFLF